MVGFPWSRVRPGNTKDLWPTFRDTEESAPQAMVRVTMNRAPWARVRVSIAENRVPPPSLG